MTIYANTPTNAKEIGWSSVPEYCHGDSSAKYVFHNHRGGYFIYSDLKSFRYSFVYGQVFIGKNDAAVHSLVEQYEMTHRSDQRNHSYHIHGSY